MTANATIAVIVCIQSALIAWIVYRFTPPRYCITHISGDDPPQPQPDPDEEWKRNLDK